MTLLYNFGSRTEPQVKSSIQYKKTGKEPTRRPCTNLVIKRNSKSDIFYNTLCDNTQISAQE